MQRSARILSVAHLPRILLKDDNGKMRWVELEGISLEESGAYPFLRQFLDRPLSAINDKNSDRARIVDGEKDLGMELLARGLAKLAINPQSKVYSAKELEKLQEVANASKKTEQAAPAEISELQPVTASLDVVKNQLKLIVEGNSRDVIPTNIQLFVKDAQPEQLAEFVMDNFINIQIKLTTSYDPFRDVNVTEVSLPFQVQKELLKRGWAALLPNAQVKLPHKQFMELNDASTRARMGFKGIWKSYFDSFLQKIYDPPVEAKVVRVLEGHRYYLRRNESTIMVELSRVACPTHQENGAYECRQLARKELVGKKFLVLFQKTKLSNNEHRAILIRQDDQMLVDRLMLEKGLATVRITTNFRSDPHRELFLQMDRRSKEDKVGIYTTDFNIFRFEDLTRLENKVEKASAREFADRVLTHQPITIQAVVEGFKDAARVVVRMPFYRATIVVNLDGVRTLTTHTKDESVQKFKKSSIRFCNDHFLQKDVQVLLSSYEENGGGFFGTVLFNKRNILEELLAEGLVRLTDHNQASKTLLEIEHSAEERQLGTWLPELRQHMAQKCKEKEFEQFMAVISHIDQGSILYYQRKSDLNTIDDIAAELEGDLTELVVGKSYSLLYYAAPFEGAYYRAMVDVKFTHKKDKSVTVFFMDYGNSAEVSTTQLRELPATEIMQNKALAHRIDLAFVEPIAVAKELSESAMEAINNEIIGPTFLLERRVFESESPRRKYEIAILYDNQKDRHPYISRNFALVSQGLLKVDENQLQFLQSEEHELHLLQLEQEARKKGLYIWFDNNQEEFERDEYMKMKGFNTFMSSNY